MLLKELGFENSKLILSNNIKDNKQDLDILLYYDLPEKFEFNKSKEVVILLMPNEEKIIETCPLGKKFKYSANSVAKIQNKVESKVKEVYELYNLSKEAYKAYLNNYICSVELNKLRDIESLDHLNLCFQFGSNIPQFFTIKHEGKAIN